ncbi:hypothetical protein GS528_05105 [Rhodococcus hoagii]|nr:hypothetical protein [Prescottella equi]
MTAETTVVQPEPLDVEAVDDEAEKVEKAEKTQPQPAAEPQPAPEPEPEPQPVQERKPEPEPEPEPESESESQSELEDSARPTSRRSRRLSEDAEPAGAHSSGLSVAEIMANMKSAESSESAPRRRRRAE